MNKKTRPSSSNSDIRRTNTFINVHIISADSSKLVWKHIFLWPGDEMSSCCLGASSKSSAMFGTFRRYSGQPWGAQILGPRRPIKCPKNTVQKPRNRGFYGELIGTPTSNRHLCSAFSGDTVVSLEAGRSLVQGDPSNVKKQVSKTQKLGVLGRNDLKRRKKES
jgi:hypothetical protein